MSDEGLWIVALVLGLVVAGVAVFLLQTFLNELHRIERGAEAIWAAGKQVAANTATTWQLGVTSEKLDALAAEAGEHERLLLALAAGDAS
jgi:hypothetical protein